MSDAYPLHWPKLWPRNKRPEDSRFKTTLAGALKNVNTEIQRFSNDSGKKVESIVISSNVTLGAMRPKDSGVAVYFNWDGISTCIAVDRYKKVEENLQAIYHCINAERTKLRHGGLNLVKAAFRGYAALPPPSDESDLQDWWVVLEIAKSSNKGQIKMAYRYLAGKYHPDKKGGSAAKFSVLQQAYDQALKSVGDAK